MNRIEQALLGIAIATMAVTAPALAQRSPAYQAARDNGLVGEKIDGYLGIVGQETPELRAMVTDLNARRRENYAQNAQAQSTTLDAYAQTQGCLLIANTSPGEMYQAFSTGAWTARTSAAPDRDPRCP